MGTVLIAGVMILPFAIAAAVWAIVWLRRLCREFRAVEDEIKQRNAELRERNAAGCRQRIVLPQGGSGTAPPKSRA